MTEAAVKAWQTANHIILVDGNFSFLSRVVYQVVSEPVEEEEAEDEEAVKKRRRAGGSRDSTAPSVSVTAPVDLAVVSGSSVTLSAIATDDLTVEGVQFKLNTNTLVGAEDGQVPYSVTWDSTAVADGDYPIIAVARDSNGNYATSSAITVTVSNTATAIVLTEIADGRIFQRAIGDTSGPVALAGSYSGSAPDNIEARILLASDDSEVVTWTVVDADPTEGTWSGNITVPQGGAYYVAVRSSNDNEVSDTGTTNFYVGMILAGYGQSNWLNHLSVAATPLSAAVAGTSYYDGTNWTTVPSANGVREILNGIVSLTGVPAAMVSGGKAGATINILSPNIGSGDTDYFGILEQKITDVGGAEFILFNQGEGDAEVNLAQATWISKLSTIHSTLAAAAGRTVSQLSLILASVSIHDIVDATKDGYWTAFRKTQIEAANQLTGVYYSHSNMDATLTDEYHYDAASYATSGKRYARAVAVLNSDETTYSKWFATAAARVDATTTDITLVHSMGTDFTPTTGITGFEVSDDGGATWEVPSAAVRQAATTIRLTHTDMGTVSRQIRYQSGLAPDRTGIVVDNSALVNPLNFTSDPLTAAGAAATPVWTYVTNASTVGTAQTQTTGAMAFSATSGGWLVAIGVVGGVDLSSVTITPNAGDPVTATLVVDGHSASSPVASIYQAEIADGATSATVTVNYSSAPFATARVSLWRGTAADFSSITASATSTVRTLATNSTGFDLSVLEGGAMIVLAAQTYSDGTTALNSTASDLTVAERYDISVNGFQQASYDVSQIAASDAASTITIGSTDIANMRVSGAHWR